MTWLFIRWKCQIQFTLSHVNWNLGMAYLRWNPLSQDLVAWVLPHYFLLFYDCSNFCYSFEHELLLRSVHFGCLILVICLSNALNCYNLFFTLYFSNSIMHYFFHMCIIDPWGHMFVWLFLVNYFPRALTW